MHLAGMSACHQQSMIIWSVVLVLSGTTGENFFLFAAISVLGYAEQELPLPLTHSPQLDPPSHPLCL